MTAHKRRRPWIVYRRALGVLRPVARYAHRGRAYVCARVNGYFVAHVDEISPDMARALGVRT